MFTFPVPGEIAQSMNLEASAGWYQIFTPSIDTKNINGYKLRVDADFLDRVVHFYSELTQDSFFDTNIVAGVDVNYWHHLESRPGLVRVSSTASPSGSVVTATSLHLMRRSPTQLRLPSIRTRVSHTT